MHLMKTLIANNMNGMQASGNGGYMKVNKVYELPSGAYVFKCKNPSFGKDEDLSEFIYVQQFSFLGSHLDTPANMRIWHFNDDQFKVMKEVPKDVAKKIINEHNKDLSSYFAAYTME